MAANRIDIGSGAELLARGGAGGSGIFGGGGGAGGDVDLLAGIIATASDPSWSGANDTGVTIALCGVPLTPETPDAEGGFRVLTPNIPNSGDLCGLRSFGDTSGGQVFALPTAVLLGHTYVEGDNDITPEDGITIPVAGFDATAYVGLYTVAVRSDVPGTTASRRPVRPHVLRADQPRPTERLRQPVRLGRPRPAVELRFPLLRPVLELLPAEPGPGVRLRRLRLRQPGDTAGPTRSRPGDRHRQRRP